MCVYSFSCGIAMAGIADWFVQQRHTEVRYYDYALMGGWVYESHGMQISIGHFCHIHRSLLTHTQRLHLPYE